MKLQCFANCRPVRKANLCSRSMQSSLALACWHRPVHCMPRLGLLPGVFQFFPLNILVIELLEYGLLAYVPMTSNDRFHLGVLKLLLWISLADQKQHFQQSTTLKHFSIGCQASGLRFRSRHPPRNGRGSNLSLKTYDLLMIYG